MVFRRINLVAAVAAAWLLAGSAAATPVAFTGELNSQGMPLGTSQADALASGISIIPSALSSLSLLGDHDLSVVNDFSMGVGNQSVPMPLVAVSDWSLTNDGGTGNVTLVVVSFSDTVVEIAGVSEKIQYASDTVGLDVTDAWSFLEIDRSSIIDPQLDPVYLFALDLGVVASGATVDFGMPYYLSNPRSYIGSAGFNVVLPRLEVMTVFVPIPEPGSGLLLGLGIIALACKGRKMG